MAGSNAKRATSATPTKGADGRWSFVVDVGLDPETGKRRQARRKGYQTKQDAQEALDELRGKARTRTYTPPPKMTFREYLDTWVAGLPTTGLKPSTVDSYRRNILYVTATLGARRLDGLSPLDLDGLYTRLLAGGRRLKPGEGLRPRSVRYCHQVIAKALGDAVRKGILPRNVAAAASPPSAKSTRAPEMNWWTFDELQRFLDATKDEPLGPLFRLAAMTGMRRGELCGLRWADVDFAAGNLEVRHQLLVVRSPGATDGGLMFSETTKTDRGRRTIGLDPTTVAVLKARKSEQSVKRLAMGAGWQNERGLAFTEADGRPLDPESVGKVFDRRVARLGLKRLRFHDLRHTHVAHLIAQGIDPLTISRRVGHASASFTLDRYGHLFPQADSDAATAVAAMVDGAILGECR